MLRSVVRHKKTLVRDWFGMMRERWELRRDVVR